MMYAIALLPALFVILWGVKNDNRGELQGCAIVCGLLGVLTGSPIFIGLDVAAVIGGYFVAVAVQDQRAKRRRSPVNARSAPMHKVERVSSPVQPPKKPGWLYALASWGWVVVVVAIGIYIMVAGYLATSRAQIEAPRPVGQTHLQQTPAATEARPTATAKSAKDLRNCLDLPTNNQIVACTEGR